MPPYAWMPHFPMMPPPWMPPMGGMGFGMPWPEMHGFGMPPFSMPGYANAGFAGGGPPGQSSQGMELMMHMMMERAAFMHRLMITLSNIAAEFSRGCQMLAQNPSQLGMPSPVPGAPGAHPAAATDKPMDIEALKKAVAGLDPVHAQKTIYAVQMMQWFENARRGGQPQPPP